MKFQEAVRAIPARLCRPTIWGSCLAWLVLGKAIYLATQARADLAARGLPYVAAQLLNTLCDPIIAAVLVPFAWQWTGDEKGLASPGRGILQGVGVTLLAALALKTPLGLLTARGGSDNPDTLGIASNIMAAFVLLVAPIVVGRVIAWTEQQEAVRLQALAQAQEAQWTLLRSQLSPHLVLNVLNGLAGLAEEDPARAARGLEDLAEVYVQLLELGGAERIPLARERELLRRYLGVEQLRLEQALRVTWHWDEALDTLAVPPLLLQPLVENAIKHGINAGPGGGELVIRARKAGQLVALNVSNTGGALHLGSAQPGSGVGIRNLRRRLALAYGDRATLSLTEDGAWTRATLLIPAPAPAAPGGTP